MTAAIVLAGGRGSRLGGVDKAAVEVGGRPLVDHVYAAVAGCDPIVAVGPHSVARPGVVVVREEPVFAGPVAALSAALAVIGDVEETWLLACDLPRATGIVAGLRAEPIGDDDGVLLVDSGGHAQWLAGRYRTAALRGAVDVLPDPAGAPLRRALADLRLRGVDDTDGVSLDVDTPDDLATYRHNNERRRPMTDDRPLPNLDGWIAELAPALGLGDVDVPLRALLDLTREVAHGVARPAGPITTYLVGLAAAQGMSVDDAYTVVSRLVEERTV